MKELGRGTSYNTHNITSLIRTPQACIRYLADGRSLHGGRVQNTHTPHTHTHTHTHTYVLNRWSQTNVVEYFLCTGSAKYTRASPPARKMLLLSSNLNMQNSIVMLTFSDFDRKYPFWVNLVQKIQIVSLF